MQKYYVPTMFSTLMHQYLHLLHLLYQVQLKLKLLLVEEIEIIIQIELRRLAKRYLLNSLAIRVVLPG